MVPTCVKDEISRIMQSKQGYILQWNEIKKVFMENSLAYTSQLDPGLLLVHPQNRGGTGINAWSMHAKGAIICQSGADLNLLMGSVCFELSLDPEKKKAQVAFNKAMSDISQGMMAEPSGQERYLSVSKGHTSQFCKAINHCAKTLMHACIAHVTSMGAPTNYEELAASLCQAGPLTGYSNAVGKFVQLYGGKLSNWT